MHPDNVQSDPRRGFTMVLALVCLLVVATIGATTVRTLVSEHRQATRQQRQLQTLWVAESALERAAAQLAADPDYTGETWQIAADEIGGPWPAKAVIRVEPAASDETKQRVLVTAHCPDDPLDGMVLEREIEIAKQGVAGES
jgi:Tfp pilus assembly protein PilX